MLKYFVVLLFLAAVSALNNYPCRGRRIDMKRSGLPTDKLFVYGRDKTLRYEFTLNAPGTLQRVYIMVSEFNTTGYQPGGFSNPSMFAEFTNFNETNNRFAEMIVDPSASALNGFVFNFVKDYFFAFTYIYLNAAGTEVGVTYQTKLRNWRFVSCDPICNARCLGDRCDMSSNVGFVEGNRPVVRINPFNCKCTTPGWKHETWPVCPFFRFQILGIKELKPNGAIELAGSASTLNTLRWTDPFVNNDGTTLISLGGKVVLPRGETSADFSLEFNPTSLKIVATLGKDCKHWPFVQNNRIRVSLRVSAKNDLEYDLVSATNDNFQIDLNTCSNGLSATARANFPTRTLNNERFNVSFIERDSTVDFVDINVDLTAQNFQNGQAIFAFSSSLSYGNPAPSSNALMGADSTSAATSLFVSMFFLCFAIFALIF